MGLAGAFVSWSENWKVKISSDAETLLVMTLDNIRNVCSCTCPRYRALMQEGKICKHVGAVLLQVRAAKRLNDEKELPKFKDDLAQSQKTPLEKRIEDQQKQTIGPFARK